MKILMVLGVWSAVSVVSSFGLAAFMRAGKETEWKFGDDALLDDERKDGSPKRAARRAPRRIPAA